MIPATARKAQNRFDAEEEEAKDLGSSKMMVLYLMERLATMTERLNSIKYAPLKTGRNCLQASAQ